MNNIDQTGVIDIRTRFIYKATGVFFSLLLIVAIAMMTSTSKASELEEKEKRVLFISSYSLTFNTSMNQYQGISDILEPEDIVFDVEYMDSKRFDSEENIENFYQSLKYKIENVEAYDLIIVGDDNALDFVIKYEDLFPNQPIVFLGINDVEKAIEIGKNPRYTGIYESVSITGTIEMARVLQPEAERVIALVDNTTTGKVVKSRFFTITEFEDELELSCLDLSTMDFEQYQNELKSISEQDIVILLAVHNDITDRTLTFEEGVKLTLSSIDHPIYTIYDFGIGSGLVGGEVISFYEQGMVAGEYAVRLLAGESMEQMPVVKNNTVKMMDYETLLHYQLPFRKLSKDVIYINRPESILRKFLPYILIVTSIILIEGGLIFYLVKNVLKRRQAERELKRSNNELNVLNEELSASNDNILESNEKLREAISVIEVQKEEISNLIHVDILTNLKNRRAIMEQINLWLVETPLSNNVAILFLDVDNFKLINDRYGHDVGDQVIAQTGSRLEVLQTENIQIGRFGGDEFIIVNRFQENEELDCFLTSLQKSFATDFDVDQNKLHLTISVGVSLYPVHGRTQVELVKKADIALYQAKEAGKDQIKIYDEKMSI